MGGGLDVDPHHAAPLHGACRQGRAVAPHDLAGDRARALARAQRLRGTHRAEVGRRLRRAPGVLGGSERRNPAAQEKHHHGKTEQENRP